MRAKITKRLVDDLTAELKPVVVFDTELAGFVLKVMPSGKRAYQLRYRMGGRSTPLRTFTLGQHGPLTPDQARRLAQVTLGDVRRGTDPAVARARERSEERGALTVSRLSAEFLEVYGKTRLKPRSFEEYRRHFTAVINPRIGGLKVRDVMHADVEKLHHSLRDTPPTANRVVATLSKFFSWLIRGGYRVDRVNPCQGLEKFKEEGRQRYLSPAEIGALGEAIRLCEAKKTIDPWQSALIEALLLTGMRRDELRTLKRQHVDLDRRVMTLMDSKTGRRDVPISGPMLELLSSLPQIGGNPFVFAGSRIGRPIVNLAKPWRRVLKASGIAHCRLHDLRHTAASVGVAAGASLVLIGGVLGHRSERTTGRYAHLADDPVRATSQAIAERVAAALEGNVARVVPVRIGGQK